MKLFYGRGNCSRLRGNASPPTHVPGAQCALGALFYFARKSRRVTLADSFLWARKLLTASRERVAADMCPRWRGKRSLRSLRPRCPVRAFLNSGVRGRVPRTYLRRYLRRIPPRRPPELLCGLGMRTMLLYKNVSLRFVSRKLPPRV